MGRHHRQRQDFAGIRLRKYMPVFPVFLRCTFKVYFQNPFFFPNNTFLYLIPPFFPLVSQAKNLRYLL